MSSARVHSKEFKAKVAMEAIRGEKTSNEIASMYEIHPSLVRDWKTIVVEGMSGLFENQQQIRERKQAEEKEALLYQQIGQLKMDLEWLKKKSGYRV